MSYDYQPSGMPPAQANSSTAIISLIAGILGLTFIPFIGSIVAVITGPMAKKEIRESGGVLGGEGMATAGQILGWIGIALGVLGICIGGAFIVIPLCLAAFSIGTTDWSSLQAVLLAFI